GLAIVHLSTSVATSSETLRTTLFHETAHAFMSCGVRLLDEGWASSFASRHAGAAQPSRDRSPLPSVPALLSRASEAIFGEHEPAHADIYHSACAVGLELVEAVLARGGGAALRTLFAAVAQAPDDAAVVALVESACGRSFAREST